MIYMDLQSVLKAILNERGITYKGLAEKVNGVTPQSISSKLNKGSSMTTSTLLKYLDILDCEMVIVNRRDKSDAWVITKSTSAEGRE